jgi:5'-3' exoribonuclease 1
MGIPAYFSFLVKNYPRILKNIGHFERTTIHNLLLDSNSIIYEAVQTHINNYDEFGSSQLFEDKIINDVIIKIEDYITFIKPSDLIYITFDGVAPLAKMKQQRTRRHKGIFLNDNKIPKWNRNKITPGTDFMNNLTIKINKHFKKREKKYNTKKILVSCTDEPGEGEHKIMHYLRNNINKDKVSTIYGLDSDLIMLSIFHAKYCKDIFIFRETPAFISSSIPKHLLNDDSIYFLDVNVLMESILSELQVHDSHRVYDYVFFCFFLGNDFLPHFPALNIRTNGFDILYNAYTKLFKFTNNYLVNKDFNIDWIQVNKFITYISNIEEKIIKNEHTSRDKLEKRHIDISTDDGKDNYITNIPTKFRMVEKTINPFVDYWQKRYYKYLFSINYSIKDICTNYVDGLKWVFNYYIGKDHSYIYKYNYEYGPLLVDLKRYFPHFDMVDNSINNIDISPFKDTTQLAYVLPYKDLNLLPKNKEEYIKKKYSYLYENSPSVSWSYMKYLWESHPHLPEISIDILREWDKV